VEAQRTRQNNSDDDTATKQQIQTSSTQHAASETGCRVTLLDGNQLDVPLQVPLYFYQLNFIARQHSNADARH